MRTDEEPIKKRITIGLAILAVVAAALVLYLVREKRLDAAADVRTYVPIDARAVLWIPRVDELTEKLVLFTRGIQEMARIRDLLKPETGVDLGDIEGLRKVGIDPEAGLAVVWKSEMAHVLFGVEDAAAFVTALQAKFANLGHTVTSPPPDTVGGVHTVKTRAGDVHAAFGAKDGLMVVVYRLEGDDPAAAVRAIHTKGTESFFSSKRFARLTDRLGDKGPMFYLDGAFLRHPDGRPRVEPLTDPLPDVVRPFIQPRIEAWMKGVEFVAARVVMDSCEALLRVALVNDPSAPSIVPTEWRLSAEAPVPDFASLLPRDTVLFVRQELNFAPAGALIKSLASLTGGLDSLLGQTDATAELLGKFVHPELADRHVVKDLIGQLTGQIGVALLGVDRRAPVDQLADLSNPARWFNQAQLVFMLELNDGAGFWSTWWPERQVLEFAGYAVASVEGIPTEVADEVAAVERMCTRRERVLARRKLKNKKAPLPPCERYGVIRRGNRLYVTTGTGTMDRVLATANGETASLPGLTREPLAEAILAEEHVLTGLYFSFDGLLKAVENRNLPGGATRYLAQMFELAARIDFTGSDARAELLLTR